MAMRCELWSWEKLARDSWDACPNIEIHQRNLRRHFEMADALGLEQLVGDSFVHSNNDTALEGILEGYAKEPAHGVTVQAKGMTKCSTPCRLYCGIRRFDGEA